jgi:hypothetical protein
MYIETNFRSIKFCEKQYLKHTRQNKSILYKFQLIKFFLIKMIKELSNSAT